MISIALHTEFFMFFTTQIGQPLDTSVHVLLGQGKRILVYYTYVFYLLQA
jgi:hypothetical protein